MLHLKLTKRPPPEKTKGKIRRFFRAIRNIFKYDPDGIFKDPKWPHLWS